MCMHCIIQEVLVHVCVLKADLHHHNALKEVSVYVYTTKTDSH